MAKKYSKRFGEESSLALYEEKEIQKLCGESEIWIIKEAKLYG